MDHRFHIDENAINTTNSFLNSGAVFEALCEQRNNEETENIGESHIATTSSFINSGNTFNSYTYPSSHLESTQKIHETTRNPSLIRGKSETNPSSVNDNDRKTMETSFIMELFLNNFNKQCVPIANIIIGILREFKRSEQLMLLTKLRGHVGVYAGGSPWIDLEACWILNLSKDVNKAGENIKLPSEPSLPDKIKFALAEGRHVPVQHIILGLHLSQFNPELKEYPCEFTSPIDPDFIQKINRSDVLRAINVHSLFLGSNFPLIGMQFATVKEYLWQFMFKQTHSAIAGMELYNEIFFNFTCSLGKGDLKPLNQIPLLDLSEKVLSNYKNTK